MLAVPVSAAFAAPAYAAEGEYLQISKTATPAALAPGESFNYRIQVTCSEVDCIDAVLTDALPAELAGFAVQGVQFAPGDVAMPRTITWTTAGGVSPTPPTVLDATTSVAVGFGQPIAGGTGLGAGQTFTMVLTLGVPADYPPGPSGDIVNTASTSAANAFPRTDSATIVIDSPIDIEVATTKNWRPAGAPFAPGTSSAIDLTVANASNIAVDALVVQEPKAAVNGATQLDASNPFTVASFTGFAGVTVPASCATVRTDAYIEDADGVWSWREGDVRSAAELVLPDGVTPDAVGGLRVTCLGDIPVGDTIALSLSLVQRDDIAFGEYRVDNVATGRVEAEGHDAVTADAAASHVITPTRPTVDASKDISPNRVAAGQSADVLISATNGAVPVTELVIADEDFFTSDLAFGGWVGPVVFPVGATSATVIYTLLDGDAESPTVDYPVVDGVAPPAPPAAISGFRLVFSGSIAADATANAEFTIATSETSTGGDLEISADNRIVAAVVDANGQRADQDASDRIVVVAPGIDTSLTKRVRPSTAVEPGETVFVSLQANARALTDTSRITELVVEDSWQDDASGFWNAFDMTGIAPTQIPADASLTVEVRDSTGAWVEVLVLPAQPDVRVAEVTDAEWLDALAAASLDRDDVDGVRLSFRDADGLAQDTTVIPALTFAARDSLRDGSGASTPTTDQPTPYVNTATVTSNGESTGGIDLNGVDDGTGVGTVITTPGGPGPVGIDKNWLQSSVNAQSGDRATTRLDWRVAAGLETVTITDPDGAFADVANSVTDAFDLVVIPAIAADAEPFSNGWYLRYDSVQSIELWSSVAGDWVTVAAPAAGWVQDGRFVGYTLTSAESQTTLGVRLTLVENTAAREAARSAGGAIDPFAPAPGAGVGFGSSVRSFPLTWQLRDVARTDGWVTSERGYNTVDEDVVRNTARIDGTLIAGGTASDTDSDTIVIADQPPAVSVAKTASTTQQIFVPPAGTEPSQYPTVSWTIEAANQSVARASFVRVTDPANCAATAQVDCQLSDPNADPFGQDGDWLAGPGGTANVFDRFQLTDLRFAASIPAQVSLDDTVVWLLRYDEETATMTSEQMSASAAAALTAVELADVIGVSATFQAANAGIDGVGGTISSANRLTIGFDSILRPTLRSTGAEQTLRAGQTVDVVNRVFAQSYDPVLSAGVATGDVSAAGVVLTGGLINITPSKSVAPDHIVIADPDVPITVTLGANQGSSPRSTLSPSRVTLEDQAESPEFWDAFSFTGLGAVTRPAGATSVRVDVYGPFGTDGELVWVEGPIAPTATMPASITPEAYDAVEGIRFSFTNGESGAFFSQTVPAPNWSASAAFRAELRETYRASGEPMRFDGTIENTQLAQATRVDGNDSEAKASADIVTLSLGTKELTVNKLTNGGTRSAAVGESVPFRLAVQNAGTGFLTLTGVDDALPPELVWLGSTPPVYTAQDGGTLSEDVELSVAPDGRTLTFTWPEDGRTMQPGEVFFIDLTAELQPGLAAGAAATNTMTARTLETLDRCGNRNAPQQGTTGAFASDPTSCGTTDQVTPVSGPNLFTVKGVSGSLPGATVPSRPGDACAPTLDAPGGPYYRTPCVANSAIGGVDDWVLRAANAGTFTVRDMVIFDQLPTLGDRSLISGASRGSTYRPELVASSLQVSAPAGTRSVVEVTTSADACQGTWANLVAQTPCEQAGETWVEASTVTDWSAVTGIRVSLDFTDLPSGGLIGGQIVDVTFSTRNAPATDADASGAPTTVPAPDSVAINQFGVKYTDEGAVKKIAPATVGVRLLVGAIEVRKEVTGAAAAYAPDAFTASVSCTVGETPLDLGALSTVELSAENDYAARIDGIPYSEETPTECVVAETGDPGSFGESSRSIDATDGLLVLREAATSVDAVVPAAQVVTVSNDYRFSGLSVTKTVDTEATSGAFGPFTFSLECVTPLGVPVTFDDDGTTLLEFTLDADATFTAPSDRIPVRSECTLIETDTFSSDSTAIVGNDTVDNGDGTATITVTDAPAAITVANGYDAGSLIVTKEVDGAGADAFGAQEFAFEAVCSYQGQTLLDAAFSLTGGATQSFGLYPSGTECRVVETGARGASSSVLAPTDGIVLIGAPAAGESLSATTVTATNTFDVGDLEVVKTVAGDGAELYGAGPFTAEVSCTWNRSGEVLPIALAGDGIVTLSSATGYRATVGGIIAGAECAVVETGTGGATSTVLEPATGVVAIPAAATGESARVGITNTFALTSLEVQKVVQGNLDAAGATGPFEVELRCTRVVDGDTVPVSIPGGATRQLDADGGYSAEFDALPAGSDCAIVETRTGDADDTLMTVVVDGAERVDTAGTSAHVDLAGATAPGQALVVVTNAFDAVALSPTDESLATTGAEGRMGGLIALLLLTVGGLLVIVRMRRRSPVTADAASLR